MPRTTKRLKALGLPSWLAAANRVIIGLGRLGIAPGPVRVLTIAGRTTGEPRTTPVTPVVVAGRQYVIAAAPRADWARNARAVGHGELRQGRRRQPVTISEVHELALQQTVLRVFPVQAPGGVPFFVRLGLVEKADPEQFAATAGRVAIFELQPADDEKNVDGDTLYKLHRASIKADLRTAKILQHLDIQDVSDEQIDAALDEE